MENVITGKKHLTCPERLVPVLFLVCVLTPGGLLAQPFASMATPGAFDGFRKGNGVAVADYDGDGDLDVYLVAYPQYDPTDPETWNRLFRNDGGRFVEVTATAGVESRPTGYPVGQMGNKFGAAWGDYDNDGDPDLFLSQIGPDVLYRNEGDGTFTDVTGQAGVAGPDPEAHDTSALWWDYDRDGDLDLYVSAWVHANRLYENRGDGTFADVTGTAGLGDTGQTWTSIPLDADRDGWPDLYVVNDFGPNRFYRNRGNGVFEEATALYGLEDPGHGMGVAVGDVNNDGFFDLYLTNDTDYFLNPLFMGQEGAPFRNEAVALGVSDADWGWGTEFFDYDLDGDLDLYAVNGFPVDPGHNFLFVNRFVETNVPGFEDLSAASGANGEADARGLVVFDYDGDGRLDMLVANWEETPYLYRNMTTTGNWLMFDLVGTASNRTGYGATIHLKAGGHWMHRAYDGVDFLGQSITPTHFGLGEAVTADSVRVVWPSGHVDVLVHLPANQRVRVKEGEALGTAVEPSRVPERAFRLLGNAPNPFADATELTVQTPTAGPVRVAVYDLLGREVWYAEPSFAAGGPHRLRIEAGYLAGSGIYLYRLTFGDAVRTGTFVVLP